MPATPPAIVTPSAVATSSVIAAPSGAPVLKPYILALHRVSYNHEEEEDFRDEEAFHGHLHEVRAQFAKWTGLRCK